MHCRPSRACGLACALAAAGALAGCAPPPGPQQFTVSRESVAATIRTELLRQHVPADAVSCPADVVEEVGRSVQCRFDVDGQPVDAIATVSAVVGGEATFAITTQAQPISGDLLARKVGAQLAQQAGLKVDMSKCAGRLDARRGAVQRCTITGSGAARTVQVVVTEVRGGLIEYVIEQG